MNINTSITSVSAAPTSILELVQLVGNAAPESKADPAAFLAALVRQFEAMKGNTGSDGTGESPEIAAAETNEPGGDPLQELLQYVSNLEAFSDRQFKHYSGAEVSGGNGLPAEGNSLPKTVPPDEDLESENENRAADPLLAALAAHGIPLTSSRQAESLVSESGEAFTSQDELIHTSQELRTSELADHGESCSHDNHGVRLRSEQYLYQSQGEGKGIMPAEKGLSGMASSGVEEPDALLAQLLAAESDGQESIKRGAGESLFPQFDKYMPTSTAVPAEGVQASVETGFPLQAVPSASQLSTIVANDSIPALDKPLNQAGWQEGLGERILWMTDKGLQTAEIKLNPAHLGPLEIRIQIDQDQATVHFATHHASVREAIEAAVPKLREMLGAQEIALADINVTAPSGLSDERGQPFDFNQQSSFGDRSQPFSEHVSTQEENGPTDSDRGTAVNGLLNLYA